MNRIVLFDKMIWMFDGEKREQCKASNTSEVHTHTGRNQKSKIGFSACTKKKTKAKKNFRTHLLPVMHREGLFFFLQEKRKNKFEKAHF